MKSWKTTLSGALLILLAVGKAIQAYINGTPVDVTSTMAELMAGIGLLSAKDSNVTGGTVQQ
jgi:hypothetical protein